MDSLDLTDAENAFCESVRNGTVFGAGDSSAAPLAIRAEVLRRVILGLPLHNDSVVAVSGVGIHARGVRIVGRLSLDAARSSSGGELASIRLHACQFDGGLSGRNANFAHLDLRNSRFEHLPAAEAVERLPTIDLRGARSASGLQLDYIGPTNGDTGVLWLSLANADIGGSLELNGARFRAEEWDVKSDAWNAVAKAGVELTGAEIKGDLVFMDGGECDGSLRMRSCTVRGDVWLSSARINGGDQEAIFGQSAHIHGLFMLDGRRRSRGETGDVRRALINGSVSMRNAVFESDLQVSEIVLSGEIFLEGARINGKLILEDIELGNEQLHSYALTAVWRQVPPRYAHLDALGALSMIHLRGVKATDVEVHRLKTRRRPRLDTGKSQALITLDHATVESLTVAENGCLLLLAASDLICQRDATLTGDFGFIDLHGADIRGSMELERTDYSRAMFFKGQSVRWMGPAVNLARATISRRLRVSSDEAGQQLMRARRSQLDSLPNTELLETLWKIRSSDQDSRIAQIGFLRHRGEVRLLTGQSLVLHQFVEQNDHCIDGTASALEYLRLFCAYVQSDDGAFRIVTSAEDLEPEVTVDNAATNALYMEMIKRRVEDAPDAPDDDALEQMRALDKIKSLDELSEDIWRIDQKMFDLNSQSAGFECCIIYGRQLFRSQFKLDWKKRSVMLDMVNDRPVSPLLKNVPQYRGSEVVPSHSLVSASRWPTPATTPPMEALSDAECRQIEGQLRQLLGISGNPAINLSDACCDTLQDSSGRGWRDPSSIRMSHFVYRKDHRFGDDSPDSVGADTSSARRQQGFGRLRRLYFHWLSRRPDSLFYRALAWLYRRSTLSEVYRIEVEPFLPDWQARLYWINRQFMPSDGTQVAPSHFRISRQDYDPQPFNQAIQVARGSGDYEAATHFEIAKAKIEWNSFSDANRAWFAVLGVAIAAAVLFLPSKHSADDWLLAGIWAALFGLLGCYLSQATNAAMDVGFGYLRRPVRAALTLLVLLLLGVWGVSFANREGFLVLDVSPVADVAVQDARTGELVLGSQVASVPLDAATRSIARDVGCGDNINEPLYALDILIPLIDLRQELNCDIGETAQRREKLKGRPETNPATGFARLQRLALDRTVYSQDFWALAKSIYAILGWIVVSLSILTFARATGSGGGDSRA